MTLRITLHPADAGLTVMRLEGRLRAADLGVFESCLLEAGENQLALDLAELRWLDPLAVERLSTLVRGGARIVAMSPFVERLLRGGDRASSVEPVPPPRSADPRPR